VRLTAWTDGGGDSTPDTEAYIGVVVLDETGKALWEHGVLERVNRRGRRVQLTNPVDQRVP
jgi:hypothetical protein